MNSLCACAQETKTGSRPNILLVMADDLGFSDLGCYGSEISTPNLDQLAARGMRFTQFYNAARCCPTRASLLTGLYPHQVGCGDMTQHLGPAAYQGFLNDRCATIAELLRSGGYRTYMAGKWHVGDGRPHWPVDRGFDRYFGLLQGASNYFNPFDGPRRNSSAMALDDKKFVEFGDRFYMTDAITDYALAWLSATGSDSPFFLYVAYTAPHSPLHARPEDIAKYQGKYSEGWDSLRAKRHKRMIDLGIVDAGWQLSPPDREIPSWSQALDRELNKLKMAVYAAQIDRMDQGIGRILDKVRDLGVEDNTLVMFLSDNGADGYEETPTLGIPPGTKESSYIYGRSWANLSNTPLRGYKRGMHEGGISTPLVARWPKVIPAGGINREPGHVIDIMATCLDVAQVPYPESFQRSKLLPLEGRSIVPIFKAGQRPPHAELYWEHEGYRAVRQRDWKLVARPKGDWELYNLAGDRTEMNDQSAKDPDKVRELIMLYEAWATRVGVVPWEQLQGR